MNSESMWQEQQPTIGVKTLLHKSRKDTILEIVALPVHATTFMATKVPTASKDAARETYNLDDRTLQGLLPSHSYGSGNLEGAGVFFTVMSNDGCNNNDPLQPPALGIEVPAAGCRGAYGS